MKTMTNTQNCNIAKSTQTKNSHHPQSQQPPAPPLHLIKSLGCKNILCVLRPFASSCLDKLPPPSSSNAAKHAAALRQHQTAYYCRGISAIDSQIKNKSKHMICKLTLEKWIAAFHGRGGAAQGRPKRLLDAVLGFRFWFLGFGFWVLGFGFWVLGLPCGCRCT